MQASQSTEVQKAMMAGMMKMPISPTEVAQQRFVKHVVDIRRPWRKSDTWPTSFSRRASRRGIGEQISTCQCVVHFHEFSNFKRVR